MLDGEVKIYSAVTGEAKGRLEGIVGCADGVVRVEFSPDGRSLAVARVGGEVELWGVESLQRRVVMCARSVDTDRADGDDFIVALAFSADGSFVAAGSDDGMVRIWRTSSSHDEPLVLSHEAATSALAFCPLRNAVAVACGDGVARVWDLAGAKTIRSRVPPRSVLVVSTTPTPRRIIAEDEHGRRYLVDGRTRRSLAVLGKESAAGNEAFSPDGRLAFVAVAAKVHILDATTGGTLGCLNCENVWVDGFAVSQEGAMVLTQTEDGKLRIWDRESCKQIALLAGDGGCWGKAAISRDGCFVAAALPDGHLRVWRVSDCSEVCRVEAPLSLPPWRLEFDRAGQHLAAVEQLTNHLSVFCVGTGARLTPERLAVGPGVEQVTFDDGAVTVQRSSGHVRIFDVTKGSWTHEHWAVESSAKGTSGSAQTSHRLRGETVDRAVIRSGDGETIVRFRFPNERLLPFPDGRSWVAASSSYIFELVGSLS
jgi:WD40 repeat protein